MTLLPTIELATRDDVPAMLAIANSAAATGTMNFATEPEPEAEWLASYDRTHVHHAWLVAREGGRVVGFAKSSPYRARGAYRYTAETSIYIDPVWQGRGLGKQLYDRLLPIMRAQGYATIFAGIVVPQPAPGHASGEVLGPSEKLHQRMGFRRVGVFERAGWKFDQWHDVGFWQLQLRGDEPPIPIRPVAEAI